ncbi:pyridoxamine 5'-phosphate oxidase family protein [Serinicoccus kebangsaanensis]|uniref:pyridoxamine 5'-phosphate oxidase family protein n=1 Tax=Serinicoccus kebangsaanensis TaxID=2602069 RepID=UPI00124D0DB7|nr:pyridoxamine 5'-phosphate oxidase family protein [Serinicoccus kebangsaanensis]
MSIVVDIDELADALGRHPTAYLLLSGEDRPHVGEVEVTMREDVLVVDRAGRTAVRTVPERPQVTLLLPPAQADGYTLIVDGEASLSGEELRIEPSHAVLHRRPRPGSPPSTTGCGNDCQPLS